ncbi:MarR family transcriptional regulator [Sandaracinobacter neustonicus]|uniref:MarR family transcriptional regulator n=1 Tax=Sandaracinobacter neustonicus TaxID=1715348 RepID=A0A501XKP3_9SPHN|nr:MarR family transcriptional regulator [Sandaracinobacter neustonicus]TPE61140.1 MarR family transcriptional regulator [Sandaracinobacter neustonicus]
MLRLQDFLPYRLSIASNAVSDRVAHAYQARFGLKIPEWRVIAVVAEQGRATQAGLVAATQMDKMTISRAVGALVERGLLVRSTADDRRTLQLALTEDGKALHSEIAPLALGIEAELLAGFSESERAQLLALLARLEACARS